MPAKKHRARHGNGNAPMPQPILLQKLAIGNNVNGNVAHNGYHHTNDDHHFGLPAINQNGTNGTIAYNGGLASSITFTPKQQQQLDRNAFLLTLTKDQLKVECRKRGQKTTGTKTELVYRTFFARFLREQHFLERSIHRFQFLLSLQFFFRSFVWFERVELFVDVVKSRVYLF